ncbi:MAG: universal stress protein [Gallionella sp.]|jgi:nucleotide-binding universal stress UspA family protein|nr:universal stress protein [Gallionella sp.]
MYERIAVAVDGSEVSTAALNEAIKLAGVTHATLLLLHVCEEMPMVWNIEGMASMPMEDVSQAFAAAGKQLLLKDKARAEDSGISRVEIRLVEDYSGRIGAVIGAEAKIWSADLLVVGSHGRKGLDHLLMGSVAESVVRTASMPVLLVRGK